MPVPVILISSVLGILFCLLTPDCFRLCFKVKDQGIPGGGGGELNPKMAKTGRHHPKGVNFSGFRYSQTPLIPNTKGAIESVRIKWVGFRENVRTFFPQGQSKLSVTMRCKAVFDCI